MSPSAGLAASDPPRGVVRYADTSSEKKPDGEDGNAGIAPTQSRLHQGRTAVLDAVDARFQLLDPQPVMRHVGVEMLARDGVRNEVQIDELEPETIALDRIPVRFHNE